LITPGNQKVITIREKLKIVVIGGKNIGKTNLINYFLEGTFTHNYTPTYSLVATNPKSFEFIRDNEVVKVRVELWDTSGDIKSEVINALLKKDTKAFILMYDMSNPDTFDTMVEHYKLVRDVSIPAIIVGSKQDISVATNMEKQIEKLRKTYPEIIASIHISAKNGEGITSLFNIIVEEILNKFEFISHKAPVLFEPVVEVVAEAEEQIQPENPAAKSSWFNNIINLAIKA
jgi:small GTP-binding protein